MSDVPQVGTVLTLAGATLAELLAEPFDVVWVDLEHGALGRFEAQEAILGAQAAGAHALVRVPADARQLAAVMLDAGADGIVLADVRSAAVAAAAVASLTHPPGGTRGWGPRRLGLRGRRTDGAAPAPAVWAQIESREGVDAAREIAAMAGVDALVVGTADLSFALGAPLDLSSSALLDAVATVREACTAAGVAFGVAGALDTTPRAVLAGASILVHSTDARLCAGAVDRAAEWLRAVRSDPESLHR